MTDENYTIRNHKHKYWTGARWQTKEYARVYSPAERLMVTPPEGGIWVSSVKPVIQRNRINRYGRHTIYFALYYHPDMRKPYKELYGGFSVWYRTELAAALYECMDFYKFVDRRIAQFDMLDTFVLLANEGSAGVEREITKGHEKISFLGMSKEDFDKEFPA